VPTVFYVTFRTCGHIKFHRGLIKTLPGVPPVRSV